MTLGPIDFNAVTILGDEYIRNQGWFWLVWERCAAARAAGDIQAIRDRDVAAEIVGVDLGRYKVAAFAVSSAFAGWAAPLRRLPVCSPDEWSLFLSIQYIAIIIVGGVGTVFGAVLGALFLGGLPAVIDNYSESIPGVGGRRASSRSSPSTRRSSGC